MHPALRYTSVVLAFCITSAGYAQQEAFFVPSERAPVYQDLESTQLLSNPAQDPVSWPDANIVHWPAFDSAPLAAVDAVNDSQPGHPFRVGAVRPIPLGNLTVQTNGTSSVLADGTSLWTLKLHVPGALNVRVHFSSFSLPDGASVVVCGVGGAYAHSFEGEGLAQAGAFWSQTVWSDTVLIEYRSGAGPGQPNIEIDQILHGYRMPEPAVIDLPMPQPEDGSPRGGSCLEDVSCHSVDANACDSVGQMDYISGGFGYVCTGALLNDADPNTLAGYFLTANHCISDQATASTLEVFWFYQTLTCNGTIQIGPSTLGSTLLANSSGSDFCFLRLADDPENGQGLAAWTTAGPSNPVHGIHHPGGSYKRYSAGHLTSAAPICGSYPLSNYWYLDWDTGMTHGGSSGSPLFNPAWQVVGQLYGHCYFTGCEPDCTNASCNNHIYGRLDVSYPSIAGHLNSVASDDGFEDNDSLAQARRITAGAHFLKLIDFDDYFAVTTCSQGNVVVTATFATAQMDLDLFLLTPTNGQLAASTGSGGTESITGSRPPGTYIIRVNKDHGWGGDYTLTISAPNDGIGPDCNSNGVPDACDLNVLSNLRSDFSHTSNPTGRWSYGYYQWTGLPIDPDNFVLFPHVPAIGGVYTAGWQWYSSSIGGEPNVLHNEGVPANGVPTGWTTLHPGLSAQGSVARWTAPLSGTAHIWGQTLPGDAAAERLHILKEGTGMNGM